MAKTGRPLLPRRLCTICKLPIERRRNKFCSTACWNRSKARPLQERFWRAVKRTRHCWFWLGTKDRDGYGVITADGQPPRKQLRAPRVSYEIHHGRIPEGKHMLHTCDNSACVNPEHLYLGTEADNTRDKVSRKRHPFGECHGRAILTESDVRIIQMRRANGDTIVEIWRDYPVASKQAIYFAATGRNWKHLS